jgi:RNA polymerase sigma-70 factor (sigma-E family)
MMEVGAEAVRESGKLGELYARHAGGALRLAYLLTGDRALAEDLCHEAFVRMIGRFRDLRNPDAFPWYLRQTVVNLARSHFRRAKVERAYLEREARNPRPPVDDPAEGEGLWERLLELPERERAAIVLRYYEDLSEAETADVLRCPVGTVKSLVSKGIARLRAEIKDGE